MLAVNSILLAAATIAVSSAFVVPAQDNAARSLPISPRVGTGSVLDAILRPYVKFGAELSDAAVLAKTTAATKDTTETGSVATTPSSWDIQYTVPVTIQDQTFELILDTGSSDLWVFSTALSAADQADHACFNVTEAAADIVSGESFDVTYGDGSYAEGLVYTSPVTLGAVTATAMAVEAATAVAASFVESADVDGLLGMAFTALNSVRPTAVDTFFDNVKDSLTKKLFAVTLKTSGNGALDFGFLNASKYTGSISYVDVQPTSNPDYWEFYLHRWALNGTTQPKLTTEVPIIVDTGTTLTYLPDAIVEAYYDLVPDSSYNDDYAAYQFPCDADLPHMGVYVAGVKHTIKPEFILWEQISATTCLGGVQPMATLPFAILGATFIRGYYVVFDERQTLPRIGFAMQSADA